MPFDQKYIEAAVRTESKTNPRTGEEFSPEERLQHAQMGAITEIAEILDIFKKHIFYGKDIDEGHLKKEIGDLLWYIALAFDVQKLENNSTVMYMNRTNLPVISIAPDILRGMLQIACAQDTQYKSLLYDTKYLVYHVLGLDFDEILAMNIAKLQARYENSTFNADKAINRKDGDV